MQGEDELSATSQGVENWEQSLRDLTSSAEASPAYVLACICKKKANTANTFQQFTKLCTVGWVGVTSHHIGVASQMLGLPIVSEYWLYCQGLMGLQQHLEGAPDLEGM